MIRGLYTSATGMVTQQKRMDVVTNNLANATTPGFKQDMLLSSSFEALMVHRMNGNSDFGPLNEVGVLNNGIHVDEIVTSFEEGMLKETGISTDFAIDGDGFFVVNTPQGERYTRAGTWFVSSEGKLVTQEGYEIQGQNGAINVNNTSFTVDSYGNMKTVTGLDKIKLVNFENLSGLRKEGGNLYSANNAQIINDTGSKIKQGYLEGSNVDLSKQMVDMIEISRSFEINQRMIKMQDEKLGKAVSEIGRL